MIVISIRQWASDNGIYHQIVKQYQSELSYYDESTLIIDVFYSCTTC